MYETRRDVLRISFGSAMDYSNKQGSLWQRFQSGAVTDETRPNTSVRDAIPTSPPLQAWAYSESTATFAASVVLGIDEMLQDLARNLFFTTQRPVKAGPLMNGVPLSEVFRCAGNAVRHYREWVYDSNMEQANSGLAQEALRRQVLITRIDASSPPSSKEKNCREKEAKDIEKRHSQRKKSLELLQKALGRTNIGFVEGGLPFGVLLAVSGPARSFDELERCIMETAADMLRVAIERDQEIANKAPHIASNQT